VRLLEAFARYRRQSAEDIALVLAGYSAGRPTADLRPVADRLGVTGAVRGLGAVSDGDLADLYACAALFVLPSLREGFGLPVLEAMASGTPVACSYDPALRELAGDAAVYFDPFDVAAMASAIAAALHEEPDRGERGLARARLFPWRRTAELTLDVYREAAAR
jgi:alpha-1,3-rhamnosyl/mannosyltransferase